MFAELRLALRAIRKTPGPAAVAILSVALGIGATTAAFSVVHAVLIDPYPYRDADRIVHLMDLVRARDFAEFQKLDVFEDVVATDAYHIVDIRRQNMLQLLMYKALFEVSSDRADFLQRLLSHRDGKIQKYADIPVMSR